MTLRWNIAQTAELKWWQNYLKKKDVGEYLSWKKGYWQNILDQIQTEILPNNNEVILDTGCGPAGIYMNLVGYKIDAVDPLLENYDKNLPHFNKADYPYVSFYTTPFEKFELNNKYSTVFCMNVINHVIDINTCIERLSYYTSQNGYLIVTIDAHNYDFFKYLFRAIPMDILHPFQYNLEEYIKLFETNNFKLKEEDCLVKEFFFNHYLLVFQKT